ncbi:MAG TPA: 6-phosphogluconolactonase, partial [Chloroflexia bacterium]|nr:6-phosphogluconolactonase [Chloroflexia bacterium]
GLPDPTTAVGREPATMTVSDRAEPAVRTLLDAETVAAEAAKIFARLATEKARSDGPFRVALSGGSTPKLLYRLLASDEYRHDIPWEKIQFYFGDERWVPPTDPDSNYKLAEDELFSKVPKVSPDNIFPMPTEELSPTQAAEQYEATLRRSFGEPLPRFDLVFLGMGDDGHTASLFPHTSALHEDRKLVVTHYVEKLKTNRITLTAPVLNAAREVVFMVAGASKAPALREVLQGPANPAEYPSQLLRHSTGKVTWLIDKAAASQLHQDK